MVNKILIALLTVFAVSSSIPANADWGGHGGGTGRSQDYVHGGGTGR